ncbi:MAG: metallophosphoesterase [Clostridia bacterium]|nr:metallophosphoesterase [Clostridia bacterium]
MKKILSVLLCVAMLFSVTALCASAQNATMTMTVASDLHYNVKASGASLVSKRNSISEDFFHASPAGDLPAESAAILKAFLEKAAAEKSDYMLLAGDLVDSGVKTSHEALALMLKDFEAKTGKKIFVVPGNHDLYGTTADEFVSIYKDFGYSEAIAKDSESKSYVADLKGNYRLIVIDSTNPGESEHGMTDARVSWVEAQCKKAKQDGKYVIAAMHHNLIDRISAAAFIHEGDAVDKTFKLGDVLAKAGVKYIFTGHSHVQDICAYEADDGSVVYEVVTGSLTTYPVPYRVVSFGTETTIETRNIDKIDETLVPDGMTNKAYNLMKSDFLEYAHTCFSVGINQSVLSVTEADEIKEQLNIDPGKNPEMVTIANKVVDRMVEALRMPLYMKDEVVAGKSIERILAVYDVLLPQTDCKTMTELAALFYEAFTAGDENYPIYSYEVFAFTRGMAAVLNYGLEEVTGEEYAIMMSYLTSFSGYTVPDEFLIYAGDGVSRFKGIETYIATFVTPVVAELTKDAAPADNNAVLAGYEPAPVVEEEEKSFWEKIADFFKKIYDYLMSIFTYYDE